MFRGTCAILLGANHHQPLSVWTIIYQCQIFFEKNAVPPTELLIIYFLGLIGCFLIILVITHWLIISVSTCPAAEESHMTRFCEPGRARKPRERLTALEKFNLVSKIREGRPVWGLRCVMYDMVLSCYLQFLRLSVMVSTFRGWCWFS